MFLRKRKFKKGFTLVELLVTISIFAILTGVVLFNQGKFNSTILLTNLAYDTALTIRQAQTYGINIKEFDNGSGGKFLPYGVHFDKVNANKSFILFADLNYDSTNEITDGLYNGSNSFNDYTTDMPNPGQCQTNNGCVNRYTIKRGNLISGLEYTKNGVTASSTVLDIVFKRPNPDAIITANNTITDISSAVIYLTSTDGSTRKVRVQSNGLIEIKY